MASSPGGARPEAGIPTLRSRRGNRLASALLLAAFVACGGSAAASSERLPSDDGNFSIEAPPGWKAVRGKGGRVLDLKGPSFNRLLLVGEWRDGTVAAPTEEHQARLRGADSAALTRPGPVSMQYGRRPSKQGVHLQGRLACLGDKYIFDAVVEYEQTAWNSLETFACKGGATGAGTGIDVGETGWRVTIPPGFARKSPTFWTRDLETLFNAEGRPIVTRSQHLQVTTGSQTWSVRRPWDTCAFWNSDYVLLEPAEHALYRGKMTFLQRCVRRKDKGGETLAYDLVYDYDGALGQAAYITLRLEQWGERRPDDPPFGATLLKAVIATLEPARKSDALDDSGPTPPATVPLLR